MKSQIFKKVVWAVDTFEPMEFQTNAQFVLGALTRERNTEIFPYHVLAYSVPTSAETSEFAQAYLALAEKRIKQIRENSDLSNMRDGQICLEGDGSVRSAVRLLLEYAHKVGAEAIVASTHSRGIVARLFMGSFAETLLLQSDIPIITVNPKTKVRETISKILFPTTFDPRFRVGFEKALDVCASLDASVLALYKQPFILTLEGSPELAQWLAEAAKARREEARIYKTLAHDKRVQLEIRMDNNPGNVPIEICSYAEEHNYDLIIMVSQTSSKFEEPRVGSTCRNVVRMSSCPVWTFKTDDDLEGEID